MSREHEALLCVFCRKSPVAARWRPFCSERCKLQDLARWADGAYRVPAEPVNPDSGDGADNTDSSSER
jgi:endogenous inhibitor of DNA gyrase (YacG/DUF329 family)